MTNVDDIKALGTIVFVGAHPDDETFLAGGLLAAAVRNGQKVACISATRGEKGVQDETRWPADKLGNIRQHEWDLALKCLSIDQCQFLGFEDGRCHEVATEQGRAALAGALDIYNPDTIITFGPEGLTGHPDHQAVSHWVDELTKDKDIAVYHGVIDEQSYKSQAELDKRFNFFFNIEKPPVLPVEKCSLVFDLSDELCDMKAAALKSMPSQYDQLFKTLPSDFVRTSFARECFVRVK